MAIDAPSTTDSREINQLTRTVNTVSELIGALLEVELKLPDGSYVSARMPAGLIGQLASANLPGPNARPDLRKRVRTFDATHPQYNSAFYTLQNLPLAGLCLGTVAEVQFGPDGDNREYKLVDDGTGPLQVFVDGTCTGPKIAARWVLVGSEMESTAGIEAFNPLAQTYPVGKQLTYTPQGRTTVGLFETLAVLTAPIPAPTGTTADAGIYKELPFNTPQTALYQRLSRNAFLSLQQDEQIIPRQYLIQSPDAGDILVTGGFDGLSFFDAWKANGNGTYTAGTYDLAGDTFTPTPTGGGSGGTGDVTQAQLAANSTADRARANHTGTQAISTVTGLQSALDGKAAASHSHTAANISDFAEAVQDAVASLLAAGTNVSLSYNDAANTLTVTSTGGSGGGLDAEAVRDAIGVALVGIGNISVVVNDAADTITISTTATQNSTDAQLRDRSTHTGTQAISTVTGLSTRLTTIETDVTQAENDLLALDNRVDVLEAAPGDIPITGNAGNPITGEIQFSDDYGFRLSAGSPGQSFYVVGSGGTFTIYNDAGAPILSLVQSGTFELSNGTDSVQLAAGPDGLLVNGEPVGAGAGLDIYDVPAAKRNAVVAANSPAVVESDTAYYGKEFYDEVNVPGSITHYRCGASVQSNGSTAWKWFRSVIE